MEFVSMGKLNKRLIYNMKTTYYHRNSGNTAFNCFNIIIYIKEV